MKPDIQLSAKDFFYLLLLTVASVIGINQYTYGMYNHFISVPFVKSIMDASLYPNDFLVAEKKYFYTLFNSGLALLTVKSGLSLHALYFSLYCLSLYGTLIAFFKTALLLFNKKETAYFAAIFLIYSFNTLGDVRTIESIFLERTFVLPLLLFAFYFFLKQKVIAAYVLSGIAFLFHPLSAVYLLGCLTVCSLISIREIGWKKLLAAFILLFVIVSPVLYLKATNPAPSLGLFKADPGWLELLRLRSSHHLFPSSWSPLLLAQSVLFIVGFGLCLKYRPTPWMHRVVMLFTGTIFLMCVAGTLFTEVIPVSIVVQFQLFRSYVFLVFIAIIYYAHFFFMESETEELTFKKVIVFFLFIGAFYSGNLVKYAGFIIVALLIFPGFAFFKQFIPPLGRFHLPALMTAILISGIAGATLKGKFTIQNKQDKAWLAVQAWAKNNTPLDAVFIVPTNKEGFRVESERTCYGDWKDGTQMFFNPEFGKEWMRRMKMLGFEDDNRLEQTYLALNETDFQVIADELSPAHSEIYVVTLSEKTLAFNERFKNKKFTVFQVK